MRVFDNVNNILRDDLKETIKQNSTISIATSCFSIYAYKELKEQLDSIKECRFIFTSPTFIKEKAEKEKREFYIPRLSRENSLYGSEFELRLRNEMTQRSIAKECAEWIKEKVTFKSNATKKNINNLFLTIENTDSNYLYTPLNSFTTVDIGCERGNNFSNILHQFDDDVSISSYNNLFNELWYSKDKLEDVTEIILENITTAYNENSPEFIYFITLYYLFSEFLEDVSEDYLPNDDTGFKKSKIWSMLYDFQKDAVLAIINKLEKYNGCILADSVGLGKTFTALAVAKYYEERNKSVLVLCPKKLVENWNTYKDNYINNPIAEDRLNYDVLFHTDLSRNSGMSNGLNLDRLKWGNYDLVIIDESHNFRNGMSTNEKANDNRYKRLMDKVLKEGVKTKVLMLSATPVNNKFSDLKNQLALAYEGDPKLINKKLNTKKAIDTIFKDAQKAFNAWSKEDIKQRTTESLLKKLDFDFFELLDSVTIARSRRHIEKYYNIEDIGKFPERNKPITLRPSLTNRKDAINYDQIYYNLGLLTLSIYNPSKHIFESKRFKYSHLDDDTFRLTQLGREIGIQKLMSTNLLKRLESSVYSFKLTVDRITTYINKTIEAIEFFNEKKDAFIDLEGINELELDLDDMNLDFLQIGKKVKIDLRDMDYKTWKDELKGDSETLQLISWMIDEITVEYDTKLQELQKIISDKIENPINDDNKKIIIFTAFADTADYLYEHISVFVKNKYGLDTALINGTHTGKTTIKNFKSDFNNILTCFSPISKNKAVLMPNNSDEIDILIATDCISEGQNLQDCDYLINYDIHWNPVRIIQRFGRIDRIGSKNKYVQLVNFWPNIDLDKYINLKERVESRMTAGQTVASGDDNILNQEEKGDLEYRKEQLKKLQDQVVDIENMSSGINIMDLGLNEFRMDLLEYMKNNKDMENKPKGMHAVVPATDELKAGVIFVLKNINNEINIDNKNRIHPFYMVYIARDGEIICDYLNPKQTLDNIRLLCKGKKEAIKDCYQKFNKETADGKNMSKISKLLSEAINSIIERKTISDIESLFTPGGTTALLSEISGIEDFELICFLVVK